MDRTGQTLSGKYELTRMIGKGGMGEVWEGEHHLTGRRVAVKVLSENYLTNRKVVARFGREARAASSVHHEGIVEILDQDKTDEGVPFLVMEFLEGESVGARIKRLSKLSQDEALAIMLPLLDALDAAHRAGVIHRDLKPDNVFIVPGERGEERIKILDFGISQKADEIEHQLTQAGSVLGTPHYMSPEQARGEPGIDARADLYSAAVLFYECLVGDVPFDAINYNALLQIILGSDPPSPRSRGANLSQALEQVLLATMDKDKQRRPASARALHDLLLEASMQEDDAILDLQSWTFATASEPPPGLDFGPEEEPALLGNATPPAATGGFARGSHSGIRPAPDFGDVSPRESGEFDFGDPGARAATPKAPPAVPAPPPAPTFQLREPAISAAKPLAARPFELPTSIPRAEPAPRPRPAPERSEAPVRPPQAAAEESGLARTLGGWLAVLVAIAALGYVATLVFNRPDPRKVRRAAEREREVTAQGQEAAP